MFQHAPRPGVHETVDRVAELVSRLQLVRLSIPLESRPLDSTRKGKQERNPAAGRALVAALEVRNRPQHVHRRPGWHGLEAITIEAQREDGGRGA
jgi:hypothetical protein